ncbi:uncharacterized protein METZ01_LOCUS37658 [marine metagenome]|uniref:Uncharacterized protein n=1 Tax=marine metagenome TaxID=408172 RepID=A0A381R0P7_9ZZZZ|tara:strand:- start:1054 stop:2088 length:1035 start_codon:yes stop_codon:yes gene_type:complete
MKIKLLLFVCTLFAPISLSFGQTADDYVAPRTEWDQPDLQGIWNFNSNTPMQRPDRFGTQEFLTPEEAEQDRLRQEERRIAADAREAELVVNPVAPPAGASSTGGYNNFWYETASIGENVRTSLIVYPRNGRLPARVEGSAEHIANLGPDVEGERPVIALFGGIGKDGPEDRGLSERCLIGFNAGPPLAGGGYNANVQIFQNKDHAVIMTEMVHDARIVPLDDRDAIDDDIRLWSGDSRGYWDGDTLVVVTKNFTDLIPSFSRYGNAKDKTLTERFTRVNAVTIDYEWTLEDPSTFTDKITAIMPITKVAGQLYEYGCHEGNYGMINILRGERMNELRAAEAEE